MKTTHQIARELLALPDVPLEVEGWCRMAGHETAVKMTDYSENVVSAILFQEPPEKLVEALQKPWSEWDNHGEVAWRNIKP